MALISELPSQKPILGGPTSEMLTFAPTSCGLISGVLIFKGPISRKLTSQKLISREPISNMPLYEKPNSMEPNSLMRIV